MLNCFFFFYRCVVKWSNCLTFLISYPFEFPIFFLLFCISCNCNCRNNVAIKSFIMHLNIFPFLNKFFLVGVGVGACPSCTSCSQHTFHPLSTCQLEPRAVHFSGWFPTDLSHYRTSCILCSYMSVWEMQETKRSKRCCENNE